MTFSISIQKHPLQFQDFELIRDIFIGEIENLFSVPFKADISFVSDGVEINGVLRIENRELFLKSDSFDKPVRSGNILFVPILIDDGARVILTIKSIDPALLAKMSTDWLLETQEKIKSRLALIRQIFIDPVSGYYNGRCLTHNIRKTINCSDHQAYLFLINTDCRSRGVSSDFQKITQTAGFIEAITSLPVFYLGASVFALIFYCRSRQDVLTFSSKLLSRMKRETFRRVHIGLTSIPTKDNLVSFNAVFAECWKALEHSEKRGPFSKYLFDHGKEDDNRLFLFPSGQVLTKLRNSWRGLNKFALLLMELVSWKGSDTIAEVIKKELFDNEVSVPISDNKVYVLLPLTAEKKARERSRELHRLLTEKHGFKGLSTGFCFWPCLKYPKTHTTINCQKALKHGLFFGPGQLTFFDSLSLNVSGDYYFDEGDYKQAARDYKLGLEIKPDDINLMNSLGVTLTEMNRKREAVSWFHKVLHNQPDNFMALVNLGFAWRSLNLSDQALSCFEKAYLVAQDHNDKVVPELYMQLGRLYCQAGRFEDALKILRSWNEDGSGKKEFQLYRLLGEALMETDRKKEAIVALQRALQLHPGSAESLSMLGFLYHDTGQGNEIGLRFCRKSVELDENNPEIWYRLGIVLFRMGRIDESLEAVRSSLQLKKKNNFKAHLLLAQIYEYNKKYYLARLNYENIIKSNGKQMVERNIALQGLKKVKRLQQLRSQ